MAEEQGASQSAGRGREGAKWLRGGRVRGTEVVGGVGGEKGRPAAAWHPPPTPGALSMPKEHQGVPGPA